MSASLTIQRGPERATEAPAARRGAARSKPDATELDLIQRARDGDHDAFGALVKRHQGRAYAVALRVLGDPALAEDAVQEALLKAYTGLPRFQGRSSFFTWFYRLVMNQCLDLKRSAPARRWVSDEGVLERSVAPALEVDGVPGPAAPLMRKQLRDRLGAALGSLRDDARRTLLLREIDELSYAEIARIEDIPVGTVMSRLYYARSRLRQVLSDAEAASAG